MPSLKYLLSERVPDVWLETPYSPGAVAGVSILVVASSISLLSVVLMLVVVTLSSFRTKHVFIRSNLGAYFVSLVLAELIQAIGSLMSARWIMLRKVHSGTFCAAQGALKNAGNVSTALWSMVIAFHTFTLIFLKVRVPSWVCYTTLVATWGLVGFNVVLGPAVLQVPTKGPFWGVSGYWCWITTEYKVEQFAMEYLFMFMTAILSIILYSLIFLRLRGNIEGVGFHITFCRARTPWHRDTSVADPQLERVGKRMLWYPLCYVLLVLPIAICRWGETYGAHIPFGVTIFADSVFLLSGAVNAILYSTTRRVAPVKAIIPSLGSKRSPPSMGMLGRIGAESFQVGSGYPPVTPTSQQELVYGGVTSPPLTFVSSPRSYVEEGYVHDSLQPSFLESSRHSLSTCSSSHSSQDTIPDGGHLGRQTHPYVPHSPVSRPAASAMPDGRSGIYDTRPRSSRPGPFDQDWI